MKNTQFVSFIAAVLAASSTTAMTPSTARAAENANPQSASEGMPAAVPAPQDNGTGTPNAPGASGTPGTAGPTISVDSAGAVTTSAASPAANPSGSTEPSATPGQDSGVKPEEKKKTTEEEWVARFAGTSFFTQTSMNVNIFTPTLQQTVNPTVETWSSFSPRYTLSKDFQLRGRITAAFEWTNSDITTNKNEFRVGDAVVQLFYRGVPSFWNGTKVNPFASVGLPVSIESRARTMIVSPGVGFQVAHPFDNVLGGEVLLLGVASFSHPFYSYTTAGLREPPPYNRQCFGGADATCANQVSGAANPSNIFTWNVLATGSWGKFSPGVLLLVSHAAAYRFKELPGLERMEDRTSLRQSSYVAAWLDYELNSWLTPEIGYQHSRSALDADGTYGNPLFSRYQDMRVYLGANVQLDSLYKTLRGQTGEAGVVRAKNEKRPVLMF